jgi:NhaP-type Na+/H+ or K+/H+ antiporter
VDALHGTTVSTLIGSQDLNVQAVAVISGALVLWAVVSSRLERFNISAPIAFVAMGLIATNGPWALTHVSLQSGSIRAIAEATLAVVLFADASRINVRALRGDVSVTSRLLGIGLPLTIAAGTACALVLITGVDAWVAALIGAIVAPTDAALGAAIVSDERVPADVRRALNVESGLNDGIATPFVNFFLAGALASETQHSNAISNAVRELAGGVGIGLAIGLLGAWLLGRALSSGWCRQEIGSIAVLALSLLSYSVSIVSGCNGFVAAFVAGLAFGSLIHGEEVKQFSEDAGTLMSWLVWFIFGAVMVVPGFEAASWREYVFAALALTIVRIGPVAISMIGAHVSGTTSVFVGWFGPRGLASVVFGLLAFDELDQSQATRVLAVVTVTVTLSVIAHGVSAGPLAKRFGPRVGFVTTSESTPSLSVGRTRRSPGVRPSDQARDS